MADYIDSVLAEIDAIPEQANAEDKTSQTDKLVSFAQAYNELFHDNNNDCYATNKDSGETAKLESRSFKDWLSAAFYKAHEKAVKSQSMSEALSTLQALARYDGEEKKVSLRVAEHDGKYYFDLCQSGNNKAVELQPGSWRIVNPDHVLFVRGEAMQELPDPVRGGDFKALWNICNISAKDQPLVLAWLIDSLRPNTPYPLLEILGEQGSGKSTTSQALRRVIDPNACDLRGAPKTTEDVFINAGVNHVVAYENLSHIPSPMQDGMCLLATGGGYAKRKLYTDADESVIQVKRPCLVNGISTLVTNQDLLDRTVCIECEVIKDRAQSADQWRNFAIELPFILGALFDLAAQALQVLPRMKLEAHERPRMLEYCYLGMAITDVMNNDPRLFLEAFKANRRDSIGRTIESSPVCMAIIQIMKTRKELSGSASDILKTLEAFRPPESRDTWPRTGKGMGDALRRSAPALRQLDIECYSLGKIGSYPKWVIQQKLSNPSLQSLQVLNKDDTGTTSRHARLDIENNIEPAPWECEI